MIRRLLRPTAMCSPSRAITRSTAG
jgi:hypothetical protein